MAGLQMKGIDQYENHCSEGAQCNSPGGSAAKSRVRKNSKDKHPEGGQQHSYNGWENQDYGQYYRLE